MSVIVNALSNRNDLGLLDFIRPLKNVGLTASTEIFLRKIIHKATQRITKM
jgi:hypothetical protein